MKEKPKTHKFERISEDKNIYLISTRQKKTIKNHGKRSHKLPRKKGQITYHWWYLLPGAYYLFEHSNQHDGYYVHRLIIREIKGELIREHRTVDSIPDWLKSFIETLPEYEEKDLAKYNIYHTS